jgi:hypothetical protein
MRFKGGIRKHTNQLNNLFVGGGVTLYSVPGSTATIRNNTVVPGKFNFTVPNSGEKYTPDMKYNLELKEGNWKKSARFVNPGKYDFRLLPDSKHLGKGFAPAAAPVWFVAPGAKSGSGRTPESPLNSLAELQKRVKSGDTVYFLKGTYTGTLSFKNLKNVTLSDLIGDIRAFFKRFFGLSNVELRIRPSYFPFTDPSIEVDMKWNGDRWLEMMGAGMVHPNVLRNCGIDPDKYQGFAFGFGLDRLAMLKYNLPDLRDLYGNDVRWLKTCGF